MFKRLLALLRRQETFTKCPRCGYQSPVTSKEEQIIAEHRAQYEENHPEKGKV
jgi:phage FluMu protein Com